MCYGCALDAAITQSGACPFCRTRLAAIVTYDPLELAHIPKSELRALRRPSNPESTMKPPPPVGCAEDVDRDDSNNIKNDNENYDEKKKNDKNGESTRLNHELAETNKEVLLSDESVIDPTDQCMHKKDSFTKLENILINSGGGGGDLDGDDDGGNSHKRVNMHEMLEKAASVNEATTGKEEETELCWVARVNGPKGMIINYLTVEDLKRRM